MFCPTKQINYSNFLQISIFLSNFFLIAFKLNRNFFTSKIKFSSQKSGQSQRLIQKSDSQKITV